MNYIKQLNAFYDWVLLNPITPKQQALYLAILNLNNKCGWKKEFTIANQTLQALVSMGKSELHKTRNELKQFELIDYEKGKKGQAGTYSIIPLYRNDMETNMETDTSTNMETNMETNPRNITKHKQNKTNSGSSTAREVFDFYEQNLQIGVASSPFVLESIEHWIDDMSSDLVLAAMKLAAKKEKRGFDYTEGILKKWSDAGVQTIDDARRFENEFKNKQTRKSNVIDWEAFRVD